MLPLLSKSSCDTVMRYYRLLYDCINSRKLLDVGLATSSPRDLSKICKTIDVYLDAFCICIFAKFSHCFLNSLQRPLLQSRVIISCRCTRRGHLHVHKALAPRAVHNSLMDQFVGATTQRALSFWLQLSLIFLNKLLQLHTSNYLLIIIIFFNQLSFIISLYSQFISLFHYILNFLLKIEEASLIFSYSNLIANARCDRHEKCHNIYILWLR